MREQLIPTSITLAPSLIARARTIAALEDRTLTSLMRRAIEQYVRRAEQEQAISKAQPSNGIPA